MNFVIFYSKYRYSMVLVHSMDTMVFILNIIIYFLYKLISYLKYEIFYSKFNLFKFFKRIDLYNKT